MNMHKPASERGYLPARCEFPEFRYRVRSYSPTDVFDIGDERYNSQSYTTDEAVCVRKTLLRPASNPDLYRDYLWVAIVVSFKKRLKIFRNLLRPKVAFLALRVRTGDFKARLQKLCAWMPRSCPKAVEPHLQQMPAFCLRSAKISRS